LLYDIIFSIFFTTCDFGDFALFSQIQKSEYLLSMSLPLDPIDDPLDLKYDYLVLSGGGVRGITLVGALDVLHDHHALDDVHTFIGSSIGALVVVLICIGYSPPEFYKIFRDLDFSEMRNLKVWNIVDKYGLDSGERIIEYLKTLFRAKDIPTNITFKKLYEKTGKRLIITATCVNNHEVEYWDYETNPDMKITDAVRITMSMPFYFTAPRYKGNVYVDGGLLDNFPLEALERYLKPNEHVIGIKLKHSHEVGRNKVKINNFEEFGIHLLYTMMDDSNRLRREMFEMKRQLHLTDSRVDQIEIVTEGIASLNFSLTDDDKTKLYNTGRYEMARWLEKRFEEKLSTMLVSAPPYDDDVHENSETSETNNTSDEI
jgi:predicted acylesterase/phospholipase RssA